MNSILFVPYGYTFLDECLYRRIHIIGCPSEIAVREIRFIYFSGHFTWAIVDE